MTESQPAASKTRAEDAKSVTTLLEALERYSGKLHDEARATLDVLTKEYIEKSRPADDFLKLWEARLTTWEQFIRAYVQASAVDATGAQAVSLYTEALTAWVRHLRPPPPAPLPAPATGAMPSPLTVPMAGPMSSPLATPAPGPIPLPFTTPPGWPR